MARTKGTSEREITLRRNEVFRLLCNGKTPKEISHILKTSIESVYDDQKIIKEKALEYFRTESNNAYGYYYNIMFETIDKLDKELWRLHITNTEDYSITDKLAIIKSIRENTTARKELLKDVINIFDLSSLKTDIKALKEIVNADPNKQISYMNVNMQELNKNNQNKSLPDNTYIVDTQIGKDDMQYIEDNNINPDNKNTGNPLSNTQDSNTQQNNKDIKTKGD